MTVTNQIDESEWVIEISKFLLKNITDPNLTDRPYTAKSQNISGVAGTYTYNITTFQPVKMGTVTVNAISKTEFVDYYINYNDKVAQKTITFRADPGNNPIVVNYSIASDWLVRGGRPQLPISIDDYAYIVVDSMAYATEDGALGGGADKSSPKFVVNIFSRSADQIKSLTEQVRQKIQETKKGFYNFAYLKIINTSEIRKEAGRHDRVLSRAINLEVPFHYELIS